MTESEVLGHLTSYFIIISPTSEETFIAYIFAGSLSLLTLILLFVNLIFFAGRKLGGSIRIALTCAIYSKVIVCS